MKVCSKCNSRINLKSILKSSYKKEGLIECDKCNTKFQVNMYLLIEIVLIALACIIMNYFIRYYPTTLINNIIRGIIAVIVVAFIYTGLAFVLPWKEYK